jgi:Tfp pilus assembly protein PilO
MSQWTQKQQLLTIVGGAGLICLLAAGGVYYAQGQIEEITAQVESKKQEIVAAETKIAQIPGLEKEVIILRENLDEYVKILPDTKELNAFVRMLNQFERQSGILGTGLVQKQSRAGKQAGQFAAIEYTYEMTATLWQAIKFINLIENYERFVSVTDLNIQTGTRGRDEEVRDGDVVHNVKLTLQTYTYNGKTAGREVQIPDYAAQREALREEIWKRMQAVRIEKYEHRGHQGRRDILVDPRERGDVRTDGPSPAEQRAIVERFVGEVGKLREMLVRMRKEETTLFEQYALEKGLREGVERLNGEVAADESRVSYAPYRLRWAKEVVQPLEELRREIQAAGEVAKGEDPFLPLHEIEGLVAEMARDCNNGMLEEAKNRYELVATRLDVPPDDPRHDVAVMAKAWHVKATTALDFKNMELRVQGVVVNREGRSGVLLNGEVY